jgi:hypothetical protein
MRQQYHKLRSDTHPSQRSASIGPRRPPRPEDWYPRTVTIRPPHHQLSVLARDRACWACIHISSQQACGHNTWYSARDQDASMRPACKHTALDCVHMSWWTWWTCLAASAIASLALIRHSRQDPPYLTPATMQHHRVTRCTDNVGKNSGGQADVYMTSHRHRRVLPEKFAAGKLRSHTPVPTCTLTPTINQPSDPASNPSPVAGCSNHAAPRRVLRTTPPPLRLAVTAVSLAIAPAMAHPRSPIGALDAKQSRQQQVPCRWIDWSKSCGPCMVCGTAVQPDATLQPAGTSHAAVARCLPLNMRCIWYMG